MVGATLYHHRQQGLTLICNPYDFGDVALARMEWIFYLSKALDFMDTGTVHVRKTVEGKGTRHCMVTGQC